MNDAPHHLMLHTVTAASAIPQSATSLRSALYLSKFVLEDTTDGGGGLLTKEDLTHSLPLSSLLLVPPLVAEYRHFLTSHAI